MAEGRTQAAAGGQYYRGVAAVPARPGARQAQTDGHGFPPVDGNGAHHDAYSLDAEHHDGDTLPDTGPDRGHRQRGTRGAAGGPGSSGARGGPGGPGASGASGRPGPAPGLVVGRRGRRLRSGAGWSWAGLVFVVCCWGIWMLAVRGTDIVGPVIGLGLVLAVGLWLFVVARLLGRTVLERLLDRERPSAWPSHLTVCVFLMLAGLTFLQQTPWIQDTWRWLVDLWASAGDGAGWLSDQWPE